MAQEFIYPTSMELMQIAQEKLPRLEAQRPIFQFFPIREVDAHMVSWEQLDNYRGLQKLRGLNGSPTRVKPIGANRYDMRPGVYGEFMDVDETEMTVRRRYGTHGEPIDISDLVMMRQDMLLERRLDRIELIGWTLLLTGTFTVAGPHGGLIHTDTFAIQQYTANPLWSTTATAHPLADLREMKLLHRGKSIQFGAGSELWVNQVTANNMLQNTNANDLFGRRHTGLQTLNNLQDVNRLYAGDDLPQIVVYDEGYLDEDGNFQLFIPNGKGVLIGKRRDGAKIGEYQMTRNANNPDLAPGAYMKVIDSMDREVPRKIDVHDGHNGGPAMFFPSAVVAVTL